MNNKLIIFYLLITFGINAQTSDTIVVYFDHNSSIPSAVDKKAISELSISSGITLFGYTDTSGTDVYNKRLAEERIRSVKEFVSVPDSQLVVQAIGETTQFGSDAQNRRVMIISTAQNTDTLVLGIQFRNRQAVILEKSYPELRKLIEIVKSQTFFRIEVHGHVCCNGNYQLSLERAKTVERELVEAGIDPEKIICFGHSNKEPRYPEINPENEAKNRRVEVVLIE